MLWDGDIGVNAQSVRYVLYIDTSRIYLFIYVLFIFISKLRAGSGVYCTQTKTEKNTRLGLRFSSSAPVLSIVISK